MIDPVAPPSITARYTRRSILQLGGATTLAVLVGACGGDDSSRTGPGETVTEFTIVAQSIKWDIDRIVVPAGREVTATIDNRDRGIPHNLHIKSPGDPKTKLENGLVTQTLRFTIDEPGTYDFVCDAHANMTGTIEAV